MDPLWSETCWCNFKYFFKYFIIILIINLCICWIIKCFNRHWCTVQTRRSSNQINTGSKNRLLQLQAGSQNSERRLPAMSFLSVCPHGTTRIPLDGFSWILISLVFFENPSRKFTFHQNVTRIKGTLHEDRCTFTITPRWIHLRIIIIRIFIYCNWVVTRWQWLFYMYTKHEIG